MSEYLGEFKLAEFKKELETLINKMSMEKYVDMPDWFLADLLGNHFKQLSSLRESFTAFDRDKGIIENN